MVPKISALFSHVLRAAASMGADAPWIKNYEEPRFVTTEPGGTGPELLLLHGLLGALSNWESLFPEIQDSCTPIALSFPLLTGARAELKIQSLAVFTEYFIRSRNLGPVSLCGNSLGGHVAMRLCLASPELVDCLILSGSSGLYEHTVDALPVRPGDAFVREHMAKVFYSEKFITDKAVREIVDLLGKKNNLLNLITAARSAKKDNLLTRLSQIEVPTLLLWGEDDPITSMQVAETFHKNIKNSKLVSIKNCKHAPMIEHPEWFATEVKKFLKENSKRHKVKA
jgi:pimeloyl-ACP methyl ester carboxylesterase